MTLTASIGTCPRKLSCILAQSHPSPTGHGWHLRRSSTQPYFPIHTAIPTKLQAEINSHDSSDSLQIDSDSCSAYSHGALRDTVDRTMTLNHCSESEATAQYLMSIISVYLQNRCGYHEFESMMAKTLNAVEEESVASFLLLWKLIFMHSTLHSSGLLLQEMVKIGYIYPNIIS